MQQPFLPSNCVVGSTFHMMWPTRANRPSPMPGVNGEVALEGAIPSSRVRSVQEHEDQFRPPSLNGGCRLGKATFAGMGAKEEDAPLPAVRGTAMEPRGSKIFALCG